MSFVLKSLTLVIIATTLNGCGQGSGNSASLPSSAPGGGGGDEVGQVSDDFYINVAKREGLFTPKVYKTGEYGTSCSIAGSVTLSTSAMDCTIDILELDNYVHPVNIQYNVPKGSCEYVVISPSWHWNFSTGYGPSAVTIEKSSEGAIKDIDASGDGGCRTVQNGTGTTCAAAEEISGMGDAGPICEYNHSSRNDSFPNCCLGTYSLTTEIDTDDDGTAEDITVVNDLEWGGQVGNCIGGSVVTSWSLKDEDGVPKNKIQYVLDKGINDVIPILSNAANMASAFQYGTNHYNTTGNPHSHSGYVSATVSNVPYAFNPIDDLDGTSMTGFNTRAPYTLTCMNRGGEVKHQINIYLREWNTYLQWVSYETSLGTLGDPDIRGSEGSACEFESAYGDDCNDFYDWDDILFNATGSTYDTSTPNAVERRYWHPQVVY